MQRNEKNFTFFNKNSRQNTRLKKQNTRGEMADERYNPYRHEGAQPSYRLIRKIGEGHSANVYEGIYNNQPVAIKIQKNFYSTQRSAYIDQHYLNFKMELDILILIAEAYKTNPKHPGAENIIKFIAFYYFNFPIVKNYSFIFECVDGGNLTNLIDQYPNQLVAPWPQVVQSLGLDVAQGLSYLHSQLKIYHCDIKPDNILVRHTTNGIQLRAIISDFGYSELISHPRKEKGGTPNFFAPEILLRSTDTYTDKIDIFSYGCMLQEMVKKGRMHKKPKYNRLILIGSNIDFNDLEGLHDDDFIIQCRDGFFYGFWKEKQHENIFISKILLDQIASQRLLTLLSIPAEEEAFSLHNADIIKAVVMEYRQEDYFQYKIMTENELVSRVGEQKQREQVSLNCGEDLRDLIMQCWHHNPNKRPTADECIISLQQAKIPTIAGNQPIDETYYVDDTGDIDFTIYESDAASSSDNDLTDFDKSQYHHHARSSEHYSSRNYCSSSSSSFYASISSSSRLFTSPSVTTSTTQSKVEEDTIKRQHQQHQ